MMNIMWTQIDSFSIKRWLAFLFYYYLSFSASIYPLLIKYACTVTMNFPQ